MKTKYLTQQNVMETAQCLKNGGVVAFPTDTVYGLGVIYDQTDALARLKQSKGRSEDKPIPMMIGSIQQLEEVACTNDRIMHLSRHFMPGGFTVILKKKENVSDIITNGFSTIAVRMPDDSFILSLIEKIGKPLLVTSANLSGMPTGVYFEDVKKDFDGKIEMIIEGVCKGSVASTIVDVSEGQLKVIRQGPISEDKLMKIWEEKR